MKRLMVGLLLAATAYVPLAAGAQRRDGSLQASGGVDRQERRAERQERRAARAERGAAVQTPAPDRDRARRDRPEAMPDRTDDGYAGAGRRGDQLGDRPAPRRDRFDARGGFRNDGRDGFGNGGRGFDGRSADLYRGGRVWNRGWRGDDRYDWNGFRDRNRNAYRLPRYYAPQGAGYGYRRFGVGVQLSRSLFRQDYWLDDPYSYRLPPAYGPYRWVRYYGDALLVDLRTGRVVDVVNDIFY